MTVKTTKVDFYLTNPDGSPVTNTVFYVKLTKAGWNAQFAGLSLDTEIALKTDSTGHCIAELVPLPNAYRLDYDDSDDAKPGKFLFYVPDVDYTVNFQDLIVYRADSSDTYSEQILKQLIQAKTDTLAAQEQVAALTETAQQAKEDAETASSAASTALSQAENANATATNILGSVNTAIETFNNQNKAVQSAAGIITNSSITGKIPMGSYTLYTVDGDGLYIVKGTPSSTNIGVKVSNLPS